MSEDEPRGDWSFLALMLLAQGMVLFAVVFLFSLLLHWQLVFARLLRVGP